MLWIQRIKITFLLWTKEPNSVLSQLFFCSFKKPIKQDKKHKKNIVFNVVVCVLFFWESALDVDVWLIGFYSQFPVMPLFLS